MIKKPITCWLRFYPEQQVYKHNHYTEGWVPKEQSKPTEFEAFSDYTWAKSYNYLKEHTVIDV